MGTFILRRVVQTVIVMLLLSFVCFYMMTLMPGDPVDLMASANPHFTSADRERLAKLYGLDLPPTTRYMNWLKDTLHGDLGYSRTYHVPVMDLLGSRLMNTFYLSSLSLLLALLLAIPFGIWSALRAGSKTDYAVNLLSFAGISVPSFWLAIMLIMGFAVHLGWLPASGTSSVGIENMSWSAMLGDRLKYMILPILSLTAQQMGIFLRYTRSAMLEAMQNDYIRTAKAKGLSRAKVIWNHGFRNALIPLITVIAIAFGSVFSGAIITEQVFAFQGAGKLVLDSITSNDFNVAMVSFNISVFMVLLTSLFADILYGFADPRISHQ
jgi:peptide/nickel transport system permease protein